MQLRVYDVAGMAFSLSLFDRLDTQNKDFDPYNKGKSTRFSGLGCVKLRKAAVYDLYIAQS
jgi:hypothetical protein